MGKTWDLEKFKQTARRAAAEGIVMLENDAALPLEKDEEAIIKSNKYSDARKQLIDRARRGDEEAIESLTGKSVDFEIIHMDTKNDFNRKYPDLSMIKMEVEIED